MAFDIKTIRENTPGLNNGIYLDNAGASLVPRQVVTVIKDHLDLESNVGGYVAQEQQSDRLENVYESLSRLLGGKASEFAMTSSASDSWGRAF